MGSDLRRGLVDAWAMVATFVPKLLGFLLVLFIGWLIAKALAKAVELLLTRTGFGRLVEKSGLGHLMPQSRIDVAGIIVKLVYYFVLLIALQLAFGVFGTGNAVSQLLNEVIGYLPRIAVAIVLLLVAAAIARVVRDLVIGSLGPRPYTRTVGMLAYGFLVALGVIAALNQLGIATTVTTPVLISVLATAGGILVVGVGGGLVRPMQHRWEAWLQRAESETVATETPGSAGYVGHTGFPPGNEPTPATGFPRPPVQD